MPSQAVKDLITAVKAFDEANATLDDLKAKKAVADQAVIDLTTVIAAQQTTVATAKAAMKAAANNV